MAKCRMESRAGAVALEDVLATKQIQSILDQAVGGGWQLVSSEIKRASDGLSGFLGDHFRLTFEVKLAEGVRKVNLFVKSVPLKNEPKAKFIVENNFFRREVMMFELFRKMQVDTDESDSWCAKAYLIDDNMVVMPDLSYRGYRTRPTLEYLDLEHTLLTMASMARFHAAFANYETKRNLNGYPPFNLEYEDEFKEPTFKDSPWLRAAAKLTKNFLNTFSDKCSQYPANLEEILIKLYLTACDSLTESNSLNVVNHRDLWVNNIMFKYEEETPVNALLIDFQCVRYGPPAFDVMVFLYMNTSRSFREKYESMVFRHYYVIFLQHLDEKTKERVQFLGYDFDDFVVWCHKARMFGMFYSIGIFPFALMEPTVAQKNFDDPETFVKYCDEDRTEPVVAHARDSARYRQRQLEVCEEFVERYVLK